MANLKISELTAAGALTGAELVEAVQGGLNVKTTTQDIANLGGGGTGDVVGPASATADVPALFDGTTGKLIKNSTPTGTGNPVLAVSPALTGTPTAPTAAAATDTDQIATTAFVQDNSIGFTPVDELTEIAGISLETDITVTQLLEALAIPGIIPIHGNLTTAHTITNMALALTAVGSHHYARPDTTNIRRMRLYARVETTSASASNPRLFIQYSIDGGTNFITLGAGTIASGDAISLFTGAAGTQNTNWITLPSEARGTNFVWRIASEGGDGALDPVVGNVYIEYST